MGKLFSFIAPVAMAALVTVSLAGIVDPIIFQVSGPLINPFTIRNQGTWTCCATAVMGTSMPALTHPLTNGSIILLGTVNFTVSSTAVAVTDTAGLTYNSLVKTQWTDGTSDYFCATNTTTQANDVISFSTAPFNGTQFPTLDVIELTSANGPLTCATKLDVQSGGTNSNSGAATRVAISGVLTSTVANDFIWSVGFANMGTVTPDPGTFKAFGASNASTDITQYSIKPTAGAFQVFMQNSVSGYAYFGYTVAVKP
jgi:hypothetical protein